MDIWEQSVNSSVNPLEVQKDFPPRAIDFVDFCSLMSFFSLLFIQLALFMLLSTPFFVECMFASPDIFKIHLRNGR